MAQEIDRDGLRYAFKGWIPNVPETALESADFYAMYQNPVAVIRFLNGEGAVLQSKAYQVGERVEAPKMVQEFTSGGVRYLFQGWEPTMPKTAERSVDCYEVYSEAPYAGHKGNQAKKKQGKGKWAAAVFAIVAIILISISIIPNGWKTESGVLRYYMWGIKVVGLTEIDGDTYCFDSSGAMCTGWQTIDGHRYYFDSKGKALTGWQTIGDHTYYFGDDGVLRIGWQEIDGHRYYFGNYGMLSTGWQKIDGKKYYFGDDGIPLTGWHTINGRNYYFFETGILRGGI